MVSFAADIKPLFNDYDRDQMRFAFDLWDHGDVCANADVILERLQAGDMPCDEPWPQERVALFRRWTETGMPP